MITWVADRDNLAYVAACPSCGHKNSLDQLVTRREGNCWWCRVKFPINVPAVAALLRMPADGSIAQALQDPKLYEVSTDAIEPPTG